MLVQTTQAQSKTNLASNFFGPNALPIIDMLDGRVKPYMSVELSSDYYIGFYGDRTVNINIKLDIPLFSPRVKLSVWMPVVEFYQNTIESVNHQASQTKKMRGYEYGDVYISTDIHIVKEKKIMPDMALRIGIKTASGDGEQHARYFDSPGYFFDLSAGKSIYFKESFITEIRTAVSAGFLVWQVNTTMQNDAIMYGLLVDVKSKYGSLKVEWGGYSGWIKNGDEPTSIKSRMEVNLKKWTPFLAYQYGIRHYPFHQIRVGVAYNMPIKF